MIADCWFRIVFLVKTLKTFEIHIFVRYVHCENHYFRNRFDRMLLAANFFKYKMMQKKLKND